MENKMTVRQLIKALSKLENLDDTIKVFGSVDDDGTGYILTNGINIEVE